ncbi:hypothetical protein ACJMK2_043520 [Sinanodonta woodiana]|uniref:non-specific serine/threonine protein kinase n=2 Tax=Sinanodonta woodiana TaxID=1069815 RepID=A0ABD3VZZ8_SINWO
MDRPPPGSVEDLATLAKLDEAILLDELKIRHRNGHIYTYVGDILVAVNPFRDLGIYGHEETNRYYLAKKNEHPPHIFAIADTAFQNMLGYGGRTPTNQCILISGESGAGKTESTKLIIKQLVELCRGNTQLQQQILQVNPLLEAFGNAQTKMNDNSSRFGKYIQLMFYHGQISGAKISEYLLEKSRVVHQNEGEENFHIFYYMFAGLSKDHLQHYGLNGPFKYRYLRNGPGSLKHSKDKLRSNYEELQNAMDLVGFTDEEQQDMFTIVSAVLHLGNLSFEEDDKDAAFIQDQNVMDNVASLLKVDPQELSGTLTSIVTITRGEHVKRYYSKQQADDARDAMAKFLYGRLFGWIVNKVNQLLASRDNIPLSAIMEVGILDIFGFEHFEHNSFEQACINLANEQLQFFFNLHVFKLEQEEYAKEGVDWNEIKFIDNQPLLDLFLSKPIGILSLLDEESHFPKGTDASFVEKLNVHFGGKGFYQPSQRSKDNKFTIHHYAGKVLYTASGWLEKNRDTLPPGVMEMLQMSDNELVKFIFRAQVTRTGTLAFQMRKSTRKTQKSRNTSKGGFSDARKRKQTLGGQFKNSLQILMERMTSASPIFVRCLKPNHMKSPGNFDEKYIREQLLYTGMLETTKIRREGFAIRPGFEEFVNKFKVILCKPSLPGTRENCIKILQASKIKGWQVGKTKVFLKYFHLDQFSEILEKMGKSAIHLQRIVRGFLARRRYRKRLELARKEAALVEAFLRQVQNLSIELGNKEQLVMQNDKNIPPSFFGRPDSVSSNAAPPPVPFFPSRISPQPSVREYLEFKPTQRMVDSGTQADSSSGSEYSEDEFVPVPSTSHVPDKGAAVQWFKETQSHQVYDPQRENFIAEWFHGVITRRDSENLLKIKEVGCFLIRVSESRFGYTLSFKAEDRVRHYMIDQLRNKKFIIVGENKVHKTLKDLVEYHRQNKISNWNGLLKNPCGQEHGQCDYEDLVDERFYFTLEEQLKKEDTYRKPKKHPMQRNSKTKQQIQRMSGRPLPQPPGVDYDEPPPPVPIRRSMMENNTPPIPDRNYSVAHHIGPGDKSSNNMNSRQLPKRPNEAYSRLLNHQNASHGNYMEPKH